MSKQQSFADVLNVIKDLAKKTATVDDVIEALESRGFGPLLLVPAVLMIIPVIGGIPGSSLIGASIIFLISIQILIGKTTPWIPKKIREIKFDSKKLDKAVKKIMPTAKFVDKYTGKRLAFLTSSTSKKIIAVLCIFLAVLMPPLEIIPMGLAVPAGAILIFGLGLTIYDGLLIALGYLASVAAIAAAVYWLM